MRNPSFGRRMLISAVATRAVASRNSASKSGRKNGSKRRSICSSRIDALLTKSRIADPVFAGGTGRLAFELVDETGSSVVGMTRTPPSEGFQELDQRQLLVVCQIGSEQMSAIDDQIGTLA